MKEPFGTRARRWLRVLAVSLDQLVCVFWSGPKYLIVGGRCPYPDETISSRVGRGALKGKRWALILESIIDRLFVWLGEPPGHCRAHIEWEEIK